MSGAHDIASLINGQEVERDEYTFNNSWLNQSACVLRLPPFY